MSKTSRHQKLAQRGVALAISLILLGVLLIFTAISATLMTSEARMTVASYNNTRSFNAAMASLEYLTNEFNKLYAVNQNPTVGDISAITNVTPLFKDGSSDLYTFSQGVRELSGGRNLVTVLDPPYNDLTARERVYRLEAIATDNKTKAQARLIRDVANYQIPIFQFSMYAFDNLELSAGGTYTLGGRAHGNRSLFFFRNSNQVAGPVNVYGPITAVGEICNNVSIFGSLGNGNSCQVYATTPTPAGLKPVVPSIVAGQGPDDPAVVAPYDFGLIDDPLTPNGGAKNAGGPSPPSVVTANAPKLTLPTDTEGYQAVEILRRAVQGDDSVLTSARYFNGKFARYSTIRILLDDDIEEFPTPIASEPRAYDLGRIGDPNDPSTVYSNFFVALNGNVRQFDPIAGTDNPDVAPGTLPAGAGATLTVPVLRPQTNLINRQPEFQKKEDGTDSTDTRKRSYIKIELINNDQAPNEPQRIDITQQILNLGMTAGPIPIPSTNLTTADLTAGIGGVVDPTTTYVNGYPLNDGISIARLNNPANSTPENFMPFLPDDTTNAGRIGQSPFRNGVAIPALATPLAFRTAVNPKAPSISYRYEPNAIIKLQRTFINFNPTQYNDVTNANPPTASDLGVGVIQTESGGANNIYRGRVDDAGNPSSTATDYPAKFKSLIAKPYFRFTDDFDNRTYIKDTITPGNILVPTSIGGVPSASLYNGARAAGDPLGRFFRKVSVATTAVAETDMPVGGASVTSGTYNSANLATLISNAWANGTVKTQLFNFVFRPGIPGFYALSWDAGNNVVGDGQIDLDVNLNGGTIGVIDLNELTAFGNLATQAKLKDALYNPQNLVAGDFPHLTAAAATTLITQLKVAEIGTPGRNSDPQVAGYTGTGITGVPEFPKENLVFDWNGDGVIEPAKMPFQNTGTIPNGNAIGYSVESNLCSLIPSSLAITGTPTSPGSLNTTTSAPVEFRFVEAGYTGSFAPSAGFTGSTFVGGVAGGPVANTNSFLIPGLPITTFGGKNSGVDVAEAVRIICQHPLATLNGGNHQYGRRLGLTDVHYAFPGHASMAFVPDAANPTKADVTAQLAPRVRVEMDQAFPINFYDQREGRHLTRRYGFQNIATPADYHAQDIGAAGPRRIVNSVWPDWPATGTVANDVRVLAGLAKNLPMPSPVALERRGMINLLELDMGNLKKFFRGDFDPYLTAVGGTLTSGTPRSAPRGDPLTTWGGRGLIDISDNGFVVYVSDRRGDDNNDGAYEFNDVYGENNSLDALDNSYNTILTGPQAGLVGDNLLRRDVEVETQPQTTPTATNPARTGEGPHGSMPVNDGFEYFCGNILPNTKRQNLTSATPKPTFADVTGLGLLPGTVSATTGTFAGMAGDGSANATGAVNWRMVDSAKTGRIRAFRHGIRVVNAMDIPRWYLNQDGPVPRHFTGMSLITEEPVYLHGNVNSVGVQEYSAAAAYPILPRGTIAAGGPTRTERFLQTGNTNIMNGTGITVNPAWGTQTNDALYHGPLSIMCDAYYPLSKNWQDGRDFLSPFGDIARAQQLTGRIPSSTTYKCAVFSGFVRSGVQTTSQNEFWTNNDSAGPFPVFDVSYALPNNAGGLENFPRMLERWLGPQPYNYNGSLIWELYSHQNNGQFLFGGPAGGTGAGPGIDYSTSNQLATSNANFDIGFTQLGGLPPATPRVVFYKIRGFRQVFLEDLQ
ncbi:MAG: hypothetical protein K1Y36_25710 [Blastocatellia bacterium]|nr:hypothetical protein [Blastocatellia bacterium]